MNLPLDIAFLQLEYANNLSDYKNIQKIYKIPDREIEQEILDESRKKMSPIERLFYMRNPIQRYAILLSPGGKENSTGSIDMIGTKDEIIEYLINIDIGSLRDKKDETPDDILQRVGVSEDELYNYYDNEWNPQNIGTSPSTFQKRIFADVYLDVPVDEALKYYVQKIPIYDP